MIFYLLWAKISLSHSLTYIVEKLKSPKMIFSFAYELFKHVFDTSNEFYTKFRPKIDFLVVPHEREVTNMCTVHTRPPGPPFPQYDPPLESHQNVDRRIKLYVEFISHIRIVT